MLAASYWSLLNPALELAEQQGWGELKPQFLFFILFDIDPHMKEEFIK